MDIRAHRWLAIALAGLLTIATFQASAAYNFDNRVTLSSVAITGSTSPTLDATAELNSPAIGKLTRYVRESLPITLPLLGRIALRAVGYAGPEGRIITAALAAAGLLIDYDGSETGTQGAVYHETPGAACGDGSEVWVAGGRDNSHIYCSYDAAIGAVQAACAAQGGQFTRHFTPGVHGSSSGECSDSNGKPKDGTLYNYQEFKSDQGRTYHAPPTITTYSDSDVTDKLITQLGQDKLQRVDANLLLDDPDSRSTVPDLKSWLDELDSNLKDTESDSTTAPNTDIQGSTTVDPSKNASSDQSGKTGCSIFQKVCDIYHWLTDDFNPPDVPEIPDLKTKDAGGLIPDTRDSGTGSCPTKQFTILGKSYDVPFQPFCDLATKIRPLVLSGAWLAAAIMVFA